MKNLFCITLFLFCIAVSAQSPTQNYVKVTTYLAPSTGEITENDTIVKVMYYDGLGRPKQIVDVRAGGGGEDIVTPVTYDQFGRQTRDYLPYATVTQNGNIHIDPMAELEAFYGIPKYGNTTNPYSEKILENSPLNRVMKQGAPGNPWAANPLSDADHSIKFSYDANAANEVRLYRAPTVADSYGVHLSTYVPTLEPSGFYNPGTLYKTITKDENWQPGNGNLHTSEEFKDFRGRVVLKRTYNSPPLGEPEGDVAHDTYYVYDRFSNLSYVIPPKVDTSDGVSDDELNELCYQYIYDHRNRLVEKKLPGKAWESIVYNKLDHPVFTRDKHLEDQGKWLFTKYDKFGRIIYTGLYGSTASREDLQTTQENHTPLYETKADMPTIIDGTQVYYTNIAFPDTGLELLTIQYYDTYNFDLDGATAEMSYSVVPTTETQTLSTGSKTRILETDKWITSVVYYDKKARPIYSYTKNPYLNTIDKVKSKVDFVGKVMETTTVHTKDGLADITTIEKFTYDRMGRLLKHTHQLAGQQEETLAENMYDELGKLIQKNVGNTPASPLQTVDYSYNIRGWLTKINDVDNMGNDLFSFDIRHNNPVSGIALYNGNISQTRWRTGNADNNLKNYVYSYDALNRITGAIHNTGNYNLNAINYDKNGNITFLERTGHVNSTATSFGVMDGLAYTYDSGNKLIRVNDQEHEDFGFKDVWTNDVEYTYDDNGNMLSDTNKGITNISYNYMNLPTQITINGENIFYIYDASGGKQQKVADGTTTQYAGGYIYENGSLKFISHPEGYIEPDGAGGYDYVYQYKDHLGNIRLSYTDANDDGIVDSSEISSEKNYYPFGLIHQGYNNIVNGTHHNWDFLNQERQEDFGLNWLTFRHRNYMPEIGRFFGVDPVSADYVSISTYQFAHNNPIWKIELEGLEGVPRDGADVINYEPGQNPSSHLPLPIGDQSRSSTSSGASSITSFTNDNRSLRTMAAMMAERTGENSEYFYNAMKNDNYVSDRIGDNMDALTMFPIGLGGVAKEGIKESISNATKRVVAKNLDNLAEGTAKKIDDFTDAVKNINKQFSDGTTKDMGGLKSAVNSASYYDTAAGQGASLFNSMAGGHVFTNGNKRTAVQFIKDFSKANNLNINLSNKQLQNLASELANGTKYSVDDLAKKIYGNGRN